MSDSVLFDGEFWALHSMPLESFWSKGRPRPRFEFPDVFPQGYTAIWGIVEGKLCLMSLNGWVSVDGNLTHVSEFLFPKADGDVLAEWYSGPLRIPQRERLDSIEGGHALVYERMVEVSVEQGIVVGTELLETGPSRRPVDAATLRLEEARPARADVDGWLSCPHCGRRFAIRDRQRWDWERHTTCGGRIALV